MINYALKYSLGESPYFNTRDPQSPVWGIAKGILYGAYENVKEEVVIEKDRGWSKDVELAQRLTGCQPQILSPVRPIPEIIASFILLSQKIGKQSKIEDEIRKLNRESNPWNLSRVIWEKYVHSSWKWFKTGYEENPECFLLLEYDDIVNKPKETMGLICTYLDVAPWAPSTTGLENPNPENDAIYGIPGLHTVKPELKRTSPPAWEVLGDDCYEFWASKNLEFWQDGKG
jgi:hypothetical protein